MESTCSNTSLLKTINERKNSSEYLGACSSYCSCSSSSNRKNKRQKVSRKKCLQRLKKQVSHPNAAFNGPPQEFIDLNLHHEDKQKLLRFVAAHHRLPRTCDTQTFTRFECNAISKLLHDEHGVSMTGEMVKKYLTICYCKTINWKSKGLNIFSAWRVQYVMNNIHGHFKSCCRDMKMGKRDLKFNLDTGAVYPKQPDKESHRKQADSFRLRYKGILENFELIRIIYFPVWEKYKKPPPRMKANKN